MSVNVRVYLSLGSNLGDREKNIRLGLDGLRASCAAGLVRVSSLYETRPFGNIDQPDFLNAAAEWRTNLPPDRLLEQIKQIEVAAGRNLSAPRWTARPLDIDILLYGAMRLNTPKLTIPHPQMLRREFVLAPLVEIAPSVRLPGRAKTCGEVWDAWCASNKRMARPWPASR